MNGYRPRELIFTKGSYGINRVKTEVLIASTGRTTETSPGLNNKFHYKQTSEEKSGNKRLDKRFDQSSGSGFYVRDISTSDITIKEELFAEEQVVIFRDPCGNLRVGRGFIVNGWAAQYSFGKGLSSTLSIHDL